MVLRKLASTLAFGSVLRLMMITLLPVFVYSIINLSPYLNQENYLAYANGKDYLYFIHSLGKTIN